MIVRESDFPKSDINFCDLGKSKSQKQSVLLKEKGTEQ